MKEQKVKREWRRERVNELRIDEEGMKKNEEREDVYKKKTSEEKEIMEGWKNEKKDKLKE